MADQDDKCAGCTGCDDLIQDAHSTAHHYTQGVIKLIIEGKTPRGKFINDSMSTNQKATVARSILAGVLRAVAEEYVELGFISSIAMMEFSQQLFEAEVAEEQEEEGGDNDPDDLMLPDEITLEDEDKPN